MLLSAFGFMRKLFAGYFQIESLSPHKQLTNAIAIFKKGSYTDAAGVKFVVTQGTLAQHNIHIETHGVREEFSPSVLGDSTPTKRVPR